MSGLLLDVLLVALLLIYLVYGYRSGFVRSLAGFIGAVVGAIVAYFLIPVLTNLLPIPELRVFLPLVIGVALIVGLTTAGLWLGDVLRQGVQRSHLGRVDRLLGAAINLVAAALVASLVATSLGAVGIPSLSNAIASSTVLRTIDNLTPTPVQAALAQLRSMAVRDGLPSIADAFGGPAPDVPNVKTDSPALTAAARSVLRITGNAYACGQSQSGSGFVVASDRVVTNAHVVAGVTNPVVQTQSGESHAGRVVYFDPRQDLAVIAVSGLSVPPLKLAATLATNAKGVFDGYPFGGPFTSNPAEVLSVGTVNIDNIYGTSPAAREVYSLAANVQEGNSGGPLLTTSGAVAGVIFAKSAKTGNIGYALTMSELDPVATKAHRLSNKVSSGTCTRG
ncbi:MAG: serine protease [Glaciihabitans sp.]|nr:serine protease [Glaciihabitans sp.]MDQ1556333.1 hypothetical protein [Actinomycetota bacterium]